MSTATAPASATDRHAATLATLSRTFGDGVFSTSRFRDNLRLFVPPARLLEMLGVLKNECGFALLAELGATDYLGYPDRTRARFEVHYVLVNLEPPSGWSSRRVSTTPTRPCRRSSRSGQGPTGWSARCSTCSASPSRAIPTCGGS